MQSLSTLLGVPWESLGSLLEVSWESLGCLSVYKMQERKVLPPLNSRVQRSIGPGVSYTPCSFDFETTLTLFEGP